MSNCVENEFYCSGCGVCFAVCSANAISIGMNEDGFYSSVIDRKKCIDCEKCLKVCTKFAENYPELKKFTESPLYAAWTSDKKTQYETSSGGIGFEIAKWGIENKYKIVGVIYDYESNKAKTVIADTLEGIERFKGSKYLQSFSADTFKYILQSKDKFIVFGTPCQTAALNMAAKEQNCRDKFVLIDFFCHGVPSYLLWESFLKWLATTKNMHEINDIKFRSKKYGWHQFTMQIKIREHFFWIKKENNPFYSLFFSDFLLNDECYLCKSKTSFDFADIRLGDFWGSAFDANDSGVSTVSVFTEAGKNIVNKLQNGRKVIFEEKEHALCIKNQSSLKKSEFTACKERSLLLNLLRNEDDILHVEKTYLKMLSFKKRTVLAVKKIMPGYLIRKFRRLYHYYKENECIR